MKPSVVCGIEIEMEYDSSKIKIDKEGYHQDLAEESEYFWVSDSFIAEQDGSLRVYKFIDSGDTVELISVPFLVEDGMTVVEKFHDSFKGYDLNKIINFNDSTGAHIHLSVLNPELEGYTSIKLRDHIVRKFKGKPVFFRDVVGLALLGKIKAGVVERVEAALPADVFNKWQSALVRSHAASIEDGEDMYHCDRHKEWNLTLQNRIEYRGFNLRGIQTWEQLFKIYEILFSVIQEVICEEFTKPKPFFSESQQEISETDCGMFPQALVDFPVTRARRDGSPGYSLDVLGTENVVSFPVEITHAHKRRRYDVELKDVIKPEMEYVIDMAEPIDTGRNDFFNINRYNPFYDVSEDDDGNGEADEEGN